MKVSVTRTGGFAGLVSRGEIDTGDDPAVRKLIDEIDLDAVPGYRPQPDRFVYEIQIGDRTAEVGEADLSGPLRELVDRVLAAGG